MTPEVKLAVAQGEQPLFLRIADAIVGEVRRGRLRPGDRLPGTRRLAEQLGVHRNTVTAAMRELRAQGWVTVAERGSTRIAALPIAEAAPPRAAPALGFELAMPPEIEPHRAAPIGGIVLAGGRPDLRLLPSVELARAWRAAVRNSHGRVLDYGDPRGHPRLRDALAAVLSADRGLAIGGDDVVVTRGAQQALYLTARALVRPGDRVAVERLGYPPAWAALRDAGAELVPIEVDRDGLRVELLENALRDGPLRAVYCTPHHQYPTMATLPAARRLALLALAERHRIAVIEDDYDNEHHYTGRPVLPLAAHDRAGTVIYVGTLSKTLAPGLRLGFLAAPRPVLEAVVRLRLAVDRQGDLATELAVACLVEDGTYGRHLRRMRAIYAGRQRAMADALRRSLGDRVAFEVPMGGLALWVEAPGADVEAWAARAHAAGVGFDTARRHDLRGAVGAAFRAGFAALDEAAIARAVDVLDRTWVSAR